MKHQIMTEPDFYALWAANAIGGYHRVRSDLSMTITQEGVSL
ncbi:hypothetical protein [Vibrio fluvialis]|nr:hypothetical protein [Vibrio fluvialis]MDE5179185.1 hypothetical protein [Vibrio fluvialis]